MNRIVKVKCFFEHTQKTIEFYGIFLDDDRILLENGYIGSLSKGTAKMYTLSAKGTLICVSVFPPTIEVSDTENVSPEISQTLEKGKQDYLKLEVVSKQLSSLQKQADVLKKDIFTTMSENINAFKK